MTRLASLAISLVVSASFAQTASPVAEPEVLDGGAIDEPAAQPALDAQPAPPIATPPPPLPAPIIGLGPNGFFLGTPDGRFQLRLRGVVQGDGRAFLDDQSHTLADTFLIRRARLYIEGAVGDFGEFRLLPDFGEGKLQLLDAWVNLRPWRWLQLRVGKMKSPFGLERLQAEQNLVFPERGLTSNLAPDRDVGASLHGEVAGGFVSYELGVFDGTVDGVSTDGDLANPKDIDARVFLLPFRPTAIRSIDLGVGFAATFGAQNGTVAATALPSFKSDGQQTILGYVTDAKTLTATAVAKHLRARYSPQAYLYVGPIGLQSELVVTNTHVVKGNSAADLSNLAWQVQANWLITGEKAGYDGVEPLHPFGLSQPGWGALEVAARVGQLVIDPKSFGGYLDPKTSVRRANQWGLAFNWYFTRNLRFGAAFDRTTFRAGAATGDRATENALIGRLQVAY